MTAADLDRCESFPLAIADNPGCAVTRGVFADRFAELCLPQIAVGPP